jgi:hypothetical protein
LAQQVRGLERGPAAVAVEHRASQTPRLVACQEDHEVGYLVGFLEAGGMAQRKRLQVDPFRGVDAADERLLPLLPESTQRLDRVVEASPPFGEVDANGGVVAL